MDENGSMTKIHTQKERLPEAERIKQIKKIKTKKYLNFQHAPKKIYKELFKEEMAERFKAIDCKSIR